MNQENKPNETPNLFAAPAAPASGQSKPRMSGQSQTGVLVRSLLIVPVTLLAFFGPIFGFAWLSDNSYAFALNATYAMLLAMALAVLVFTIMLLDILRVSRRKPKPEKIMNHEFPDSEL